jgi:hypothetical protein
VKCSDGLEQRLVTTELYGSSLTMLFFSFPIFFLDRCPPNLSHKCIIAFLLDRARQGIYSFLTLLPKEKKTSWADGGSIQTDLAIS